MNPQNESFENCVSKQIHKTNLLNTVGQNESMKRIFWKPEDSDGLVYPIVLKIHEDLSDSLNLLEIASQNESTIRVFYNLGNKSKQNESMDLQNESMFLRISYKIPASLDITIRMFIFGIFSNFCFNVS